jgi:hypothetical protein
MDMNYQLHYEQLISKHGFKSRPILPGHERHHIIPKSLGGDNSLDNLVYLTGRQHYLAHWLLYKIHNNFEMAMAFFMMNANKSNYVPPKNVKAISEKAMYTKGMSFIVKTPLGLFNSYRDAAAAHNIPESTFQDILRRKTEGFIDIGDTRKIIAASGSNHGMARRIKTPLGYFGYVGAAAKAHGISNKQIARRCKENPDEFYYLDPPKQVNSSRNQCNNSKKVCTPLGTFESIMEAANAHSVSRSTMRYKLKSENMPDFYVVD